VSLLTKRGHPIGIALPWDDAMFENGYRQTVLIDGYKEGNLSLSQLARALEMTTEDALEMVGKLGISMIDGDLEDEILMAHSLV
jgi:predicted HTH domain antitoxin